MLPIWIWILIPISHGAEMSDQPTNLAARVRQFNAGSLPGQAVKFCRPTTELIRDLWQEREQMIETLRVAQMALTDLPKATRDGYASRALANISILLEETRTK